MYVYICTYSHTRTNTQIAFWGALHGAAAQGLVTGTHADAAGGPAVAVAPRRDGGRGCGGGRGGREGQDASASVGARLQIDFSVCIISQTRGIWCSLVHVTRRATNRSTASRVRLRAQHYTHIPVPYMMLLRYTT